MHNKPTRFYITFCLFCLVSCLLPPGVFAATPALPDSSFTLTLAPKESTAWRTWRPVYNTEMTFVATLSGTDATQSLSDVTYTFTLSEVSSWPGHCMNMGTQTASDKDLEFRKADQPTVDGATYAVSNRGQMLTVTFARDAGDATLSNVDFTVRVLDYAAIGKLQAAVNKTVASDSQKVLWIPLDNNGNDIADGWKNDATKDYDPWEDAETGPTGNAFIGDGLTVFEEYRGFIVQGEHTSTLPTDKDLFVYSEFQTEGIGYIENLPAPIKVHQIRKTELHKPTAQGWVPDVDSYGPNALEINYNACTNDSHYRNTLQVVGQRALWIRDTDLGRGVFGVASGGPDAPHVITGVQINKEFIRNIVGETQAEVNTNDLVSWPGATPNTSTARISELIKRTITHEVGHGVNVYHPWNDISNNLGYSRTRYHDQATYHATTCEYEPPQQDGTLPHSPTKCGSAPYKTWVSGSTVMDYGSERDKKYYTSDEIKLSTEQAECLVYFMQAITYNAMHLPEYKLVSPMWVARQNGKSKPARKTKAQWSPDNTQNRKAKDDGAPGAPQAPSRPGCGGSPYCNDTGRCSSTGNASQSTCGKSSCFCSGNPTRTAPTASCGTSGVSTTGRWAGMHGCNNQGTCARTGYSNVSSCARAGCACRPTPIPTTGCGGGAYCNDRGSCSSTGNASQSTCGKSSCFCTGNPTRTAPTASCGTSGVSTTGRWAGMHGCNNQGTCARTGYSNVSSCARAGCACRPTPIPTTGCGGGAYCNDRGSCSSTGNASQSACRRSSCFCTGNPTRTAPTASCGTSGVSTTGRWAGMHGCNNQGTCARTGYSNVSSCARAGCACGLPTSDTNSSGNNTSTPPTPPTPPSSSGNNTSTPVTLPCGDSPTSGGNHGYVTRCPATNGRGARCTNATGYYACTPHKHTYPSPPMHPCGTHQRTVSGNHAWVSSCTVTDPHGQTCTNASGYYACTPHQHTYPSPPPCGVHPVGAAGNHARVSSCAVTNSQNQTCTNTTGYYACTPHQHTYPPPPPPCGVHTSGTNGSHHWVATCAVNNHRGQTCNNASGYYACTPHKHTYPAVPPPPPPCGVHTSGTNGSHHWIASCAVTSRGQTCTNTSGYYACTPHTHTYPSPPLPCGVHTSGTNGSHHWIASCAITNSRGQTCTNTSGYYACTPHTHTYPSPPLPCGVHQRGSGGNHSYIRCPSRQNGYQCTGYRYACQTHTHTYPRVRPCRHLQSASGRHHWVSSCAVTNRHEQTCTNTSGYYACTPHKHTYSAAPPPPPCGVHQRGSGGNHSYIRCPSRQNGYQCTGYRYACQTHTHTYPRVRPCRHLQSASGRHHWVSSCAVNNRHGQTCTNTSGYYACTPHNHTYPQRMHRCGEHPRSSGGNHSYGRCTTRQNGAQCTGYRYACKTHEHTYPTRPCKHSYSSGGNHSYIRCPSRQNGYQCTGYRYACKTHEHTYPTRPCKHSYSSGGNHNYIRCPSRWNGHQCTGYRYACRSHTHTYPRVRPCGHSYSSGGNHARVSCPRNAAGDACSSGNYYVCRSHTHRYPARRPCGHSYSSGGNHTRVTCPRNAAGDACSSGNYYVCRSHTHAYPARRPCGHLLSDSRNHTYGRCTTRQNGAQCTGYRYACKTHTHTYPRPCGHLQSASGNHNYGRCTTRQNGAQCTGSRYACKTHTHTYRRPCGHLQSASGNHNYGRCTTTQNGQRCIGSRYACKSHNHTYRRPCGHLQSASGNHNYGRCTTTRNGQRCIGSRYACKTHTHTYPTSSGNNSSGNNSSGNNSSGNDSSGNNSSGNNSSGNNSSGARCGNTARGTSACSSGGDAPTRTSHRARCRRGHTYWGCNPNAVRWHSRH